MDCSKDSGDLEPADMLFRQDRACCPICETSFEYAYLNYDCFVVESTGLNMKPRRRWKKRVWSRTIPGMFYMVNCPQCSFCGDAAAYHDPVAHLRLTLPLFRRKISGAMQGNDPILQRLKDAAQSSCPSFAVSVMEYLRAIHLLRLFRNVKESDSLRLGRYCLHLSWLLQDIDRSGAKSEIAATLEALKEQLRECWPDVPLSIVSATRQSLEYYTNCYYLADLSGQRGLDHSVLLIMARLNLYLNNFREAEGLIFKDLKKLNEQLAAPRRQLLSRDPETLLAAQTSIMEINVRIVETQQLLEMAKELRFQKTP